MNEVESQTIIPLEKNGIIEYHLKLGNKHLIISVNRISAFAEAFLENTDNEPQRGTTTTLHIEAKRLLQLEAAEYGPITYQMSTGFTTMKNWIQTTGDNIFCWQRTYNPVDDAEIIVAETIIYP